MGEEIIYHGNNYTDENKKQFRTLTFALNFRYGNDCVYIAYHYPYTFTRLMVRTAVELIGCVVASKLLLCLDYSVPRNDQSVENYLCQN